MKQHGFTLAELVIAMGLLGVIATFTISKVLVTSQTQRFNAVAKEAVAMVSVAFQQYKMNNSISTSTSLDDLVPYFNYIRKPTSGNIDDVWTYGNVNCSWVACYQLASGAIVWWYTNSTATFSGVSSIHAVRLHVDPDGVANASSTGPGKSAQFLLYANGRIADREGVAFGTIVGGTPYGADAIKPDWLSW
jgi:prepilin-type N-terminal cleavage/methylation domain-containing protein